MSHCHNHMYCGCEHDVVYCKICDVAYCRKCGKEWKSSYWSIYTGTSGTINTIPKGTWTNTDTNTTPIENTSNFLTHKH
jgi:hypothetical protein